MNVPALPKIEGDVDIILDIYSHKSLKGNYQSPEYGDTDRLVELGARVLDMVLTTHFFRKSPFLTAQEISEHTRNVISDNNLKDWLTAYNMNMKYRTAPGSPDLLESATEMRNFFHSYVGALYIRNGLNPVQAWIYALVDPNADLTSLGTPPPPPLGMAPPLPQNYQNSPPQNLGSPNMTLALVNQTAITRGVSVTYTAESTGPPHAPTWSVTCCMSGIPKGQGTGKSQKIAKEEAARQAFQAMGW
ncbi:hypothetical protein DFH09DRAFT_1123812 [Mycena vulgaris]|nr:hypothetical protein DFH09DRAFT_1123812 [Mycena vulgaris]